MINFDEELNNSYDEESRISEDDVRFVVENTKNMSISEMVVTRNLTEQQINIILDNIKRHLLIAAQDNYDHLLKIEKYIGENLTPKGDKNESDFQM